MDNAPLFKKNFKLDPPMKCGPYGDSTIIEYSVARWAATVVISALIVRPWVNKGHHHGEIRREGIEEKWHKCFVFTTRRGGQVYRKTAHRWSTITNNRRLWPTIGGTGDGVYFQEATGEFMKQCAIMMDPTHDITRPWPEYDPELVWRAMMNHKYPLFRDFTWPKNLLDQQISTVNAIVIREGRLKDGVYKLTGSRGKKTVAGVVRAINNQLDLSPWIIFKNLVPHDSIVSLVDWLNKKRVILAVPTTSLERIMDLRRVARMCGGRKCVRQLMSRSRYYFSDAAHIYRTLKKEWDVDDVAIQYDGPQAMHDHLRHLLDMKVGGVNKADLKVELKVHENFKKLHNETIDGLTYKAPTTLQEVYDWGRLHHHCIATYATRHFNGQLSLFSVWKDGGLLYCGLVEHGRLVQLLGKYNQHPPTEDEDKVRRVVDHYLTEGVVIATLNKED